MEASIALAQRGESKVHLPADSSFIGRLAQFVAVAGCEPRSMQEQRLRHIFRIEAAGI